MPIRVRVVLAVLLAGGCQCLVPVSEDGGVGFDAGAAPDANVPTDGGAPDGGVDAGGADAGVSVDDAGADAGALDAGVDAGAVDAGAVDAGAVDAGAVDAGAVDAGAVDAGAVDAGVDGGGSDAGTLLTCASVRCTAWSTCIEDGGATCVPTVTALRWVLPVADAAVPIDTIRLAVAVEVTGSAESIPVSATGAGQANTVALRTDGGLAVGGLSFVTLDAGVLVLTAGWSGGPEATTTVRVVPSRAVEVVGPNPPSHGVNTADFEPNDPEGDAWRRDDVVPFRAWPGVQVIAQHLHPDASAALIDAGEGCDGGCASFRLQDVEFNAFRGEVELRVASDAGWEARGERLTVTRWRWRRVVAGVPNPIRVQTPVMSICRAVPWEACIVVGSEDSAGAGRIAALTEEGLPMTASWLPQSWSHAVTAPADGCHLLVAGSDGDAGFLWSGQSSRFGAHVSGERYVLMGGTDATTIAVTDHAGVVGVPDMNDIFTSFRPVWPSGRCRFDGGTVEYLAAARFYASITSSTGERCVPELLPYDAGTTTISAARVFPLAVAAGPIPMGVTTDGRLAQLSPVLWPLVDAGVTDTIVQAGNGGSSDFYVFTTTPALLRVAVAPGAGTLQGVVVSAITLPSRVVSPPIFRQLSRGPLSIEGVLYAFRQDDRLSAVASATMSESWSWRPDAGLALSSPIGFAPSVRRLGSVLLPARDSVISIVADGVGSHRAIGWTQVGGDAANCGSEEALLSFGLN